MKNVHVPVAGQKNYLCQWVDSCATVIGRITHNGFKWNNYYSFLRMD